ncbi:hypothetical protein [Paraburkholderia phenoliruptrix]|uniref:hypothetical protein n=1 Tax=Paraburkholderia phenoliruptrix TaxID=252970 RepID=UPI002869A344|nr:hypothetical protein [Paraburkholderia phenoliruptrix]WMY08284.1 hypothetical protein P3F88_00450 [Paraburkholderia phenoliruptrix]
MTTGFRHYRGLEVCPLVYPHRATEPGRGHNYDEGFDAAVRIEEPTSSGEAPRSRVFRLAVTRPFQSAGDARRASTAYAERLIDTCSQDTNILNLVL